MSIITIISIISSGRAVTVEMSPHRATTKPAPTDARSSRTWRAYGVLAMRNSRSYIEMLAVCAVLNLVIYAQLPHLVCGASH